MTDLDYCYYDFGPAFSGLLFLLSDPIHVINSETQDSQNMSAII